MWMWSLNLYKLNVKLELQANNFFSLPGSIRPEGSQKKQIQNHFPQPRTPQTPTGGKYSIEDELTIKSYKWHKKGLTGGKVADKTKGKLTS